MAKNVNVFVQPMIYDIVKKRPADPAAYAVKWLEEFIQKKEKKGHDTASDNSGDESAYD